MGAIDLQFIQDQLDCLNVLRLQRPLNLQEQSVYETLCRAEHRLLQDVGYTLA